MNIIKNLQISLITPIKAFKLRYLPLLLVYFAYGASGFSAIANSFWVKEYLNLSSAELLSLGVWLMVPWTIKMVFGQLVDSFSVFGSRRKGFIFIGASFIAAGIFLMIALTGDYPIIQNFSKEKIYILSAVLSVIGFVLQDVTADTMSTEVVDRSNKSDEEIKQELAMVQILGRLSLGFAALVVAGLGGWLAQIYSYETIFKISLIIPIISVTGALLVNLKIPKKSELNSKIFFGGLIFAVFVIIMGYNQFPYSQEIVFFVSLSVILLMLYELIHDLDKKILHLIVNAMIIIFVFRAMPSVGPALQWWEIDVLGFDKAFFGTLAQIGAFLALVGMWIMSDFIVKQSISKVLIFLIVISTLLSLPIVGMYYGLHEWTYMHFGIDARDIALIDAAIISPFDYLSMVLMLTLVAIYAPEGKRGTWFALMTSLMNLALGAGGLLSKYLNQIYTVSRDLKDANGSIISTANYDNLGILLIIVISIGFIIPIVTILKYNPDKKRKVKQLS